MEDRDQVTMETTMPPPRVSLKDSCIVFAKQSLFGSVFVHVVSQTHAIGLVKEVQHFVIGSVLS
jgi:hypothetical protein